jgi:hypothetical protein
MASGIYLIFTLILATAPVLVFGVESEKSALPSFKWLTTDISHADNDLALLEIDFHDGQAPDIAALKRNNPIPVSASETPRDVDPCIYSGTLTEESDVEVALNGCPGSDNIELVFSSKRSYHNVFVVKDGQVEADNTFDALENLKGNGKRQAYGGRCECKPLPAYAQGHYDIALGNSGSRKRQLPSSMTLTLSMNYDTTWANQFGSGSVNEMRAILNMAQTIYRWTSLQTSVTLCVRQERMISGSYSANEVDLRSVSAISRANPLDVNAYAYMVYDGNRGGTIGIAWVESTCAEKYYRSSLNEWFASRWITAVTLSHEIGHNLGMYHDFTSSGGNRFDNVGRACTNIGGIMDYSQNPYDRWSTCSVQDFTAYRNQVVGSTGGFCIATGNTCGTTPSPPTPPPCNDQYDNCIYYRPCCRFYSSIRRACPETCGLC